VGARPRIGSIVTRSQEAEAGLGIRIRADLTPFAQTVDYYFEVTVQRAIAFLVLSIFLIPTASAADRPWRWRTVWRVSQALLVGADAADAASSWGKNEANPLVRAGQRFSYGSLAIKLGALSGGLAAQHLILRKTPGLTPLFASANLAAAALLGVAAVHNMRVPAR